MRFLFYARAGKSIKQIRDTLGVLSNKSSIFKTKKYQHSLDIPTQF
ncbi:hypothetical protein J2Y38_002579 [Flavobacterium sp. 2755]|nr:hypothetical protein [Flavobacterium sp. 2755]